MTLKYKTMCKKQQQARENYHIKVLGKLIRSKEQSFKRTETDK